MKNTSYEEVGKLRVALREALEGWEESERAEAGTLSAHAAERIPELRKLISHDLAQPLNARQLFDGFTSRSRMLLASRDKRFCDEVLGHERQYYSADTVNELLRLCDAYAAKAKRKGSSV